MFFKKWNLFINITVKQFTKKNYLEYIFVVSMRNQLPTKGPHKNESAIINLDDSDGPGTHWVTYRKIGNNILYFDSFGNLRPPLELVDNLGVGSFIKYNHDRYQDYGSVECGHLCLKFLCGQLHIKHKYCLYKKV